MATKLEALFVTLCVLLLTSCSAPWASGQRLATVRSTSLPSASIVTRTVEPTSTLSTSERAIAPTTTPFSTQPAATPAITTAVPTPTQSLAVGRVSGCCGTFSWIDSDHVLVFDNPAQGQSGAWAVDVKTGTRQFVSAGFGLPSSSGLVAVPNKTSGKTAIRRLDGSLVATINNGGVLTWISPNGLRVAWLEDLGATSISSLVPRTVKLWSANIDGTNTKSLLEFDAAAIVWLPDNRHVVALARAPGGGAAGIWSVDTTDGTNAVVVRGTFLQSLRLSPDGTRMAYLETFSGTATDDGVWVSNVDGSNRIHLQETGAFRWASRSTALWFLNLAPLNGGDDELIEVDIATAKKVSQINLGGRVLNDEWEVNPDGDVVAYWSEKDQSVMVKSLKP